MSNRLSRIGLPVVCLLCTSFSTGSVIAGWEGKIPKGYYNQGYGDFPPLNIEQTLFEHLTTADTPEKSEPLDTNSTSSNQAVIPQTYNNPVQSYSGQNYSGQNRQNAQQPAYGRYEQRRNHKQPNTRKNNRSANFNGPWNSNGSSFSGPWNNRGSGFNPPGFSGSGFDGPGFNGSRNNNRSGFSGPWNNSGPGSSMPWGNSGPGFGPGGNSGSGFNPMGSGGSWGW